MRNSCGIFLWVASGESEVLEADEHKSRFLYLGLESDTTA